MNNQTNHTQPKETIMNNTTTQTKHTYSVEFPSTVFYKVYVEGEPNLTKEEVLSLVKVEHLYDSEVSSWNDSKDTYRVLKSEDKEVFCETTEEEVEE